MNKIKTAVIAAAGLGSRLNKNKPKCLVEVNGHKIIEYQLEVLKDIPDVRIVVGYKSDEVIDVVRRIRNDVKIIVNEHYDKTNTLQSYYLGCNDLHDYFILLDGDIIPHKQSFNEFIDRRAENCVGICEVETEDAVFVHIDQNNEITGFSRTEKSEYEWSNIAIIHSDILVYENTYVYEQIEKFIPVKTSVIKRLEIDTPGDLEYACKQIENDENYNFFCK
ncbi:MAG: NTP transferase domain-containing protein [Porcipelethomonas sp.]